MNHNTHDRRVDSVFVPNNGVGYTAYLGIGMPRTTYTLVIDTGSSNTWIGASTPYVPTGTSSNTTEHLGSSGSTPVSGIIYEDTVTLGNRLTVTNFPLAVASTSEGFRYDGVLGIGPEYLTLGTLTAAPLDMLPTLTDFLYDEGNIGEDVLGIFFQPVTADPESDFGEPDYT
ncbi:aspartic peptidase domain-containing protein [Suillus spraguei]|nr:aspartic peptidase domain-containing protein [Suillus spraguei]